MKTLAIDKPGLIKLWKERCSKVSVDTVLENIGGPDIQMRTIKIDEDLSLGLVPKAVKIIFGEQIEYLSENLTDDEFEELQDNFLAAEETIDRLNIDRIMSNGIRSLENLLDD